MTGTSRIPHFVGIGAQKSATTWLDRCLRKHPELWLPPIKELHYFTHRNETSPRFPARLIARNYMGRRLRRLLRARIRANLKGFDLESFIWDYRYFIGTQSDAWYASLFEHGSDKITGEITPEYSKLSADEIRRIHDSFPDLKLVYLMRDPIDRTWSQVRMIAQKRKWDLDSVSDDTLLALVQDPGVSSRSEYVTTLDRWGQWYEECRFFIAFMEEVQANPRDLLLRLFSFLDVGADTSFLPARDLKPVNRGERRQMPRVLERELARLYLDDLCTLEARFGEPVRPWRQRAEQVLAT